MIKPIADKIKIMNIICDTVAFLLYPWTHFCKYHEAKKQRLKISKPTDKLGIENKAAIADAIKRIKAING